MIHLILLLIDIFSFYLKNFMRIVKPHSLGQSWVRQDTPFPGKTLAALSILEHSMALINKVNFGRV